MFISIAILFSIAYAFIQWQVIKAWEETPDFEPEILANSLTVSVLIPARNEENNIKSCLESILSQSYPSHLVQVILLDDHSEDETVARALEVVGNVRVLRMEEFDLGTTNSFKKKAIELGVEYATGDIIITTDADCQVGRNWIAHIVGAFEQYDAKAVTSPVLFHKGDGLLHQFQALDMMGMMGVTAACQLRNWADMANGANLAYTKKIFYEVDRFNGSEDIASGDDMFLISKIGKAYPDGVHFLKSTDAVVYTEPVKDWKGLIRQRIRWATKSKQFKSLSFWAILVGVGGMQVLLSLSAFLLPFGKSFIYSFILLFCVKSIFDFSLLRRLGKFFHYPFSSFDFIKCLFIHIIYFPFIGLASLFNKTYTWKGRTVK